MLKNFVRLESIVNGKFGHFFCENDAPLEVVKEMLFQFQKYVGHVEDQVRSKQEEEKPKVESTSIEEPKTE